MIAVIRRASHRIAVEISLSTSSSILFYLVTLMFFAAPTDHSSRSVHFAVPSLLSNDCSNTMYLMRRIFLNATKYDFL